jgi:hypothetical protein
MRSAEPLLTIVKPQQSRRNSLGLLLILGTCDSALHGEERSATTNATWALGYDYAIILQNTGDRSGWK